MDFFDSGGWSEANSDMPKLLLLLEDPAMKRRLERAARAVRRRFGLDDEIEIYVAMAEDLLSGDTTAIWSSIDETSEFLALEEVGGG